MQKMLYLIARLIVARHECTHVRHCKVNAPIYMYYVAPETPMMSSVIADCPDLAPPQIFWKSLRLWPTMCGRRRRLLLIRAPPPIICQRTTDALFTL